MKKENLNGFLFKFCAKDLYVLCKLLYKSDTSPPVEHPYVEEDEDDEGEALLGEVIEEEEAATAETSKPEQVRC